MHFSISQVAERLGKKLHQVEYLLRIGRVKPKVKIGHAWMFDSEDVEQVRRELRRMEQRRIA